MWIFSTFFLNLAVTMVLTLALIALPTRSVAAPQISSDIKSVPLDSSRIDALVWPHDTSPYNFSFYGGFSGGNFFEADRTLASSVLGFRFSLDTDLDHAWDYNAEVVPGENLVGVHVGKRYFIFSETELMPYYKFAVGTHLKGSDGLANFVEIKRWQARASAGMANVFSSRQHIYIEGGLGAAIVGIEYFLLLGLNFNI